MKIIKMDPSDPDLDVIDEAIEILSQGNLIIYPTDTVYGLGANIFNKNAINKIYDIKQRDNNKALSICVFSIESISYIAHLSKIHENLVTKNLPGQFTFLMWKKKSIPRYLIPKSDYEIFKGKMNAKIGVRIPNSEIARQLAQIFPITATSANLSGQSTLESPKEIYKQLKQVNKTKKDNSNKKDNKNSNESDFIQDLDLAIDIGPLINNKPSTVVDLTKENIEILRQGSGILK